MESECKFSYVVLKFLVRNAIIYSEDWDKILVLGIGKNHFDKFLTSLDLFKYWNDVLKPIFNSRVFAAALVRNKLAA